MATTRRRIPRLGALLLAGASFVACVGGEGSADSVSPDRAAVPYVLSQAAQADSGSTLGVADAVPELLPNWVFQRVGDDYQSNSDTVVRGRPTDVRPAEALVWPPDAEDGLGVEVPFDDPEAQSRSWIVSVAVTDVVVGAQPSTLVAGARNSVVQVRVISRGGPVDVSRYRAGLLGLGDSVWFLKARVGRPGQGDEFRIAWQGGAVATVGRGERLSFPLLGADLRGRVEDGVYTVSDLRSLGRRPTQRVEAEPGERDR